MKRFAATVEIDAPVDRVWSLVDRLEDWPRWTPSIKSIERRTPGPLGPGTRLGITVELRCLRVRLIMTVVEFSAGRRAVMEGRVFGMRLRRFYEMEPVDAGRTRVTCGGEFSGPLAFLAGRGGQAVSDDIARSAKRWIEQGESSSVQGC